MKTSERDELLGRLDERSQNTWNTIDRVEKHLDTQNGILLDHTEQIAYNTQGRRNIKWIIGGVIFVVTTLFVVLFNVTLP
ncbi:hypothetical protein LCGC14_1427630 [marine sediment metagenome]|uniref:Uncharacterized protein n=1 Tax=marine sediment metagenome TaxID=412755 RepID=A0A0F9KAM7_9ZZZZ